MLQTVNLYMVVETTDFIDNLVYFYESRIKVLLIILYEIQCIIAINF